MTPEPKKKKESEKKEVKSAPPKSLTSIENFEERFEEIEKKKKKRKRSKKENKQKPYETDDFTYPTPEETQKDPINYFPFLKRDPKEGDHISFRLLELGDKGRPELTEYKVRNSFIYH